MRYFTTFMIALLFWQNLNSQTNLRGKVTDTEGEPLPGINILIYKPGTKLLIAFAISDGDGNFRTSVSSPADSLDIEASSIHCRKEYRRIANVSQNLQFVLEYDTKQLETFTVKASPIERRGDTLSYLVSSFAKKEDRAIEDVIKRMPGIEVEPNGQILYQGLPLLKFYVEGLDLMSGRYGVISKNLPHGTVSTVEILENHQPIRILEERVYSQQAALNLKLKRDITTTGTAKIETGYKPWMWDVNLTPMAFTKNFQVVTSYQSNNSGKDVSQQLNMLTLNDFLENAGRPDENPGLLGVQSASPPQIEQNRYLDNKIHLFNFNGLIKMNKDFQLRANLYYVNDRQQQQATLYRNLFTPSDTLSFEENISNQLFNNYLLGEFTLNRNVTKNYLNNKLKIKSHWDKQSGLVLNDSDEITQNLHNPVREISNELQSVNPIGKHLVRFQSYFSYDHSPHYLAVSPGQFPEILNDDIAYENMLQKIDLKRFYTDESASFVLGWKRFTFTPRAGFAYRWQTLESNLFITRHNSENEIGTGFLNEMEGRQTRTYLQTDVEYKKGSFSINAKLPFSWQMVQLKDLISADGQNINRFLFDPGLSIDYKFCNFWRVWGSWNYTNKLGDMDRVHYGFILKNYRNLSKNAAPLSETTRHSFSSRISYRNPITSFFNNINYMYSESNENLIYSSLVQADGTTIIQATMLPNTSYSNSIGLQSSKYIAAAKTTISIRANYFQRKGKSLMNSELFNTTTQFYSLMPDLNFHITDWLNAAYTLDASYIQTFIENDRRSNISMLKHKFNCFAFPTKSQSFSFSAEYYDLKGDSHFFADFLYRYTISKRKMDMEFRWNNIFNTKTYTGYQASAFTVYESTYFLRPSQVLLSVKFSF